MVIVAFPPGEKYAVNYTTLDQYDYGQILRIQGLKLPKTVEVHFSTQETGGTSITRVGVTKDGVTDVPIPDSVLENGDTTQNYSIFAFVYITDATSGKTEYRAKLEVKARPKPEVPGGSDNPDVFRDAVLAVRESALKAEEDAKKTTEDRKAVEDAVESVKDITEQVARVEELSRNAQEAATQTQNAAQEIITDREQINTNKEGVAQLKEDIKNLKENGSGLTETSSKLLIKVLRNGLYANDMSEDIDTLEIELGANIVSYAIANNLTNATNNNVETSIKEGFSYSASIVADLGYILSNVTVTMGGNDITSEVYSGGVINIPSVTGNIIITATAIVSETTMYSITNTFTNVSTDNPSTSVEENGGYSANLTPTSGYLLESVTVTMGGVDITSSAYANGVVTISSVTGNVAIIAIASEPQSEEVVLLKSITGDGASYIDTEFIMDSFDYRYEFDIQTNESSDFNKDYPKGYFFFGADMYNVGTAYHSVLGYLSGKTQLSFDVNGSNSKGGSWNIATFFADQIGYCVCKNGFAQVYTDAEHTTAPNWNSATTGASDDESKLPIIPLYLFTVNYNSGTNGGNVSQRGYNTPKKMTLYNFRVYQDSTNTLAHEFLPARQGAKIGMYDTVTQKFHENKGGGTFSYEEVEA